MRAQQIRDREKTRRMIEVGDAIIGRDAIVPASWPKAWIGGPFGGGVYMPLIYPEKPRDRGVI